MRSDQVAQTLRARLRRRTPWVITGLFFLIFTLLGLSYYAIQGTLRPLVLLNGVLSPFLVSFTYGFLSPVPWQWTGDERPQAGYMRGAAQGLAYHACLILLLSALSFAMLQGTPQVLQFREGHPLTFWQFALTQMTVGSCLMTLIGGIIAHGETSMIEKLETARRLREARDVLLRSQLAPHALFNALNGLAELVRNDPRQAESAILDLSELLRVLLRQSQRTWATLGEERDIAERYLRLESLRLGSRLRLEWYWDSDLNACTVPCLLLQTLVENALKHGISPHPNGGDLRLSVHREEALLRLEVANTGRPLALVMGEGVGLTNLEHRLRLAYEGRARFQLVQDGPWTKALVYFPEVP